MKLLLIDPFILLDDEPDFGRFVTEVEHNGDYRDLYRLLTAPGQREVTAFEAVYPFGTSDCLYLDEEGRLFPYPAVFQLDGWSEPYLVGRGIVAGTGRGGETVEPRMTAAALRKLVAPGLCLPYAAEAKQ